VPLIDSSLGQLSPIVHISFDHRDEKRTGSPTQRDCVQPDDHGFIRVNERLETDERGYLGDGRLRHSSRMSPSATSVSFRENLNGGN
jgi:hypothetical protein